MCENVDSYSVRTLASRHNIFPDLAVPGIEPKNNQHFVSAGLLDVEQADAVDFVVEGVDLLTQKELSSRLRLNYCGEYVRYPQVLQEMPVTVIDVMDDFTLPEVSY